MRKITQNAVNAFQASRNWSAGNMMVHSDANAVRMYLHGNLIAEKGHKTGSPLVITLASWPTVTTRERLTGLLSAYNAGYVAQRGGRQVIGDIHLGELGEREISDHEFIEVSVAA